MLYAKWDVIFQKGDPLPYLQAMVKINDKNPYVEVDKNIVISKRGECQALFEDFKEQHGLEFVEQAGSGYIFTDGTNHYTISSEIYWSQYTVWTLPAPDDIGTIPFHDKRYKKAELSEETIEWLEWYNTLSENEQFAISYIPDELYDYIFRH